MANLGDWIEYPIMALIKEDAKPCHTRTFPILHVYKGTFKNYLD